MMQQQPCDQQVTQAAPEPSSSHNQQPKQATKDGGRGRGSRGGRGGASPLANLPTPNRNRAAGGGDGGRRGERGGWPLRGFSQCRELEN